jgi:AcrR family transcriptional regulator
MGFSEFRAGTGHEHRGPASLRARLLWGAQVALLRHGVDTAEIGDITAAVGLPATAFHRCFASKDSLVEALVAEVVAGNGVAVEQAVGRHEDPAAAVAAYVRQTVRATEGDPLLARMAARTHVAEALADDLGRRVLRSLSRGVWVGRFPVPSAQVHLCALRGAVLEVLRGRLLGLLPAAAADELAAAVLQMLGLPVDEASAIATQPLPDVEPPRPWAGEPEHPGASRRTLTCVSGRR